MFNLEGSRILITGGAGFVGSFITDQLLDEGVEEVVIIDNFHRGSEDNLALSLPSGKVRLVEGDITDYNLMSGLFKGIDYCFHMAALRITRCCEAPREAFEVMFRSVYDIIELSLQNNVKKIVAASSASVYGNADDFPTTELHHPYNNRTFYGVGKTAEEGLLRSFHDMNGLKYAAMRYFNVYGPRMDTYGKYTEVLIRWYNLIKEGKAPLIFGDGNQTMDFVYIEDVARSNILAMKADVEDECFNVAFGRETSLKELCYALLKAMHSDIEPEFVPLPPERANVEVGRRLADTSKAEELIGFKAQIDLEEGLGRLVKWLDGIQR